MPGRHAYLERHCTEKETKTFRAPWKFLVLSEGLRQAIPQLERQVITGTICPILVMVAFSFM